MSGLAAGSARQIQEIAGLFVLSLVPIAIAYHLAHYLSCLLIAGQYIVPLISDPFGFGWDLFGTAGYKVDITLVGAKFVWYSALATIVLGHVLAVGVAHFVALETFGSVRAARRSQLPFLLLMVGYTVVSLWILAQPIVGSPSLGTLRAPSGRLVLEPFTFRELCLELSIGQSIDYEFRSEQPVAFDFHYLQGLAVRYPVQMNSVRGQAARFLAPRDQSYCLMWFNRGLTPSRLTYRLFRPS